VLKNIFVAAKVFAFLNLLFVPSIAVLLAVACTGSGPWWFTFLGLPALFINVWIVLSGRVRKRVWAKLSDIGGQPSPSGGVPRSLHKG
jgi:hypothetical protein